MARPLHAHHQLPSVHSLLSFSTTPTLLLLIIATVAAIAAVVISLCTTNKHSKHMTSKKINNKLAPTLSIPSSSPPKHYSGDRKLISTLSGIGSKALVVAKMVSWKRGGGDDDGDDDDEEAVWRKSILMGEKCRPLDFSGQILYDSEGNQVKKELHAREVDEAKLGGSANGSDVN